MLRKLGCLHCAVEHRRPLSLGWLPVKRGTVQLSSTRLGRGGGSAPRHYGEPKDHRGRAVADGDDEFSLCDARSSHRHRQDPGAPGDRRRGYASAYRRNDAAARTGIFKSPDRGGAAIRRGASSCRTSADTKTRHDRRQSGARRSRGLNFRRSALSMTPISRSTDKMDLGWSRCGISPQAS